MKSIVIEGPLPEKEKYLDQLVTGQLHFVYIVKKGQLHAFKFVQGKTISLGNVEFGEFVGEMAYVNGGPRSANVEALTECEVVEIPVGALERLLYRRPSWARKLLQTLSKRLKAANELRIREQLKP